MSAQKKYTLNNHSTKDFQKNYIPHPYTRKVSNLEHIFRTREKQDPTFCINILIEGIENLTTAKLQNAVNKAADVNPGSRLIYKNNLWVDSLKNPTVREVDLSTWNNRPVEEHPLFHKMIDSNNGPTAEVILGKGNPTRLIFRCAHSAMDGHGAHFWAQEVFRALRGEPLKGTNSNITDLDILRKLKVKGYLKTSFDNVSPTGTSHEDIVSTGSCGNLFGDDSVVRSDYRRFQVPCSGESLTARILKVLADENNRRGHPVTRVFIPVDLRHHVPDIRSTANLTNGVTLEAEASKPWQQI